VEWVAYVLSSGSRSSVIAAFYLLVFFCVRLWQSIRPMSKSDYAIIGGGLVGLATAYRLLQRLPKAKVTVLEKESGVGRHQSTHNSGVLHCGLYYRPGSHKARLAVSGIRQMTQFCRENDIAHDVCGKLVVATTPEEVKRLDFLFERGNANGLTGVRRLDRAQMRVIEPNVGGLAALHVPEEGIADYAGVVATLARKIGELGGAILTSSKVTGAQRRGSEWILQTASGEVTAGFIINCGGLYADRVCKLAGETTELQVVPFRGEYFKLRRAREHLVRNLIYPVPDPQFPFLGVHFTRIIEGGIEAGPNAVLAFAREGYKLSQINLRDLAEALSFPGLWRFIGRHRGMCFREFAQSLNADRFCRNLQTLVPDIRLSDLDTGGSGRQTRRGLPHRPRRRRPPHPQRPQPRRHGEPGDRCACG
jgi:L-2-hydroxyglutarate oxidase